MRFIKKLFFKLLGTPLKKGFAGIWEDEDKLIEAIYKLKQEGFKKFETISPHPLHEIDEAMEIPRSRIPWVTFIFGTVGCLFGLWLTWWISVVDWPLIIGGKPMWSLPAFIPVIFEITILFAALSSVGALLFICGLPDLNPFVIDPDLSSHKFAIFVEESDKEYQVQKIEKIFKNLGAIKVVETKF